MEKSHSAHLAPQVAQNNVDTAVVDDFGKEWQAFNQQALVDDDLLVAFDEYFRIFPFHLINDRSTGFDMGCGSGRWARVMAPKVGHLNCVDPSPLALEQAQIGLSGRENCSFECSSVADSQIAIESQDFGYCLGVLHHIPDTVAGLSSCVAKLKPGAPFLLYLYYRFDNKPAWFRLVWRLSDIVRRVVSKLPFKIKLFCSQVIALTVYWPLARTSLLLEKLGVDVINIPLSVYRNKPLYSLRTDALDRFGTKLEKRFTKNEIEGMMLSAGLNDIQFSDRPPFWVAVGVKS